MTQKKNSMPKKGDPPETRVALRRDAEARLERKPATQPPQTEANQRLQHELEVHEVELELQNEELRISQAELRAALERSSDVFDFAPVGYFGLAADGAIGLLNHDGASLVGLECGELKGRHLQAFLTEPDQPVFNDFLQRVFRTRIRQAGEVTLVKTDQTLLHVHIEAALSLDGSFCRLAMFDITEQKRVNAVLEARLRLSEYALGHSLDELLTRTLDEAERLTGSTIGFFHFVEADQKTLSLQTWSTNTLRNMCSAEGKGRHYAADQAGVWVDALRDRCPMIHNDYASLPHRQGLPPGHAPVLRELVVPVLRHEQVVALLGVGNKPGPYGPEDVKSVSQLANQAWDIVLAKRAEEALNQSRRLLAETEKVGKVGGWEFDVATGKQTWTEEMYRIHELDLTYDPTVENGLNFYTPASRPIVERAVKGTIERGEPFDLELEITTAKGNRRSIKASGRADLGNHRVYGFFQDITEQKQAAEALRRNQAMLARTESIAQMGSWEWEVATDAVTWSDEMFRMMQRNPAEGAPSFAEHPELYDPADMRRLGAAVAAAVSEGTPYELELRAIRQDGETRICLARGVAEMGPGKTAARLFGSLQDITERKQAEAALAQSEKRFRTMFEESPLGVALIDSRTGHICEVNPKFAEIAGRTRAEMIVIDWMSITHPDDVQADLDNMARLNAGEIPGFDMNKRYRRPDGSYVWIHMTIAPIEVENRTSPRHLCMIEDITERRQIEAQNRQLHKAESLGRMAGAIAHNFNNQLQVVIGNLELALDDMPPNASHGANLSEAIQSARKAAAISTQMLTYLGQSHVQHEPLDLSEACRRSLPLLQAALPQIVVLETDLPTPGLVINANASQIQQVLTQLFTNAWEASRDGVSAIRLAIKQVSAAAIPALNRFPIDWQPRAPAYACLEVADSGCGIAAKDIEKIFDPFFTRKFIGRGLGLAVVLGIVREHGGGITLESEPGRGSVFRVFLPVTAAAAPPKPVPVVSAAPAGGRGAVLVIEGEPALRATVSQALQRAGFTVFAAVDGTAGVELFEQHRAEIQCVLCDLTMPRLDGWETLTALRQLAPGLPFILSSGYDNARVMAGQHPELPQAFLHKPYELKALIILINQVWPQAPTPKSNLAP